MTLLRTLPLLYETLRERYRYAIGDAILGKPETPILWSVRKKGQIEISERTVVIGHFSKDEGHTDIKNRQSLIKAVGN